MKVSLKSKAEMIALLTLHFIGLAIQKAADGTRVAILQLEEPLPNVRGSQEVEVDGKRYPVTASDVTEIKVHEDDWNEDFQFDQDTDTGSYKGSSLILDVSKQGQVWLRNTTFASAGNEMRRKGRNDRFSKLVGAHKGAGKTQEPEAVDATTK